MAQRAVTIRYARPLFQTIREVIQKARHKNQECVSEKTGNIFGK